MLHGYGFNTWRKSWICEMEGSWVSIFCRSRCFFFGFMSLMIQETNTNISTPSTPLKMRILWFLADDIGSHLIYLDSFSWEGVIYFMISLIPFCFFSHSSSSSIVNRMVYRVVVDICIFLLCFTAEVFL